MDLRQIVNQKGISLLEVMIAMIIFSLGVLGMAPLMMTAIEGNVIARDQAIAANLIKQQIEFYAGLDSIAGVPFETKEVGLRSDYTRVTSIRDNATDSLIPSGLLRIDVEVRWTDHQQKARSQEYSTYLDES